MDDLIRHIWMHGTARVASPLLTHALMILIAIGSIIHSRLFRHRDIDAIWTSIVVATICIISLILLAVLPSSPLIGVTGSLYPSPWVDGLIPALCTSAVVISITFGLVSGKINTLRTLLDNLTYGIQRWPWAILAAMAMAVVMRLFMRLFMRL